jgi:hypothetical protein
MFVGGQVCRETPVFDRRTEAEMRLHSEKLARELALAKQQEEGNAENNVVAHAPPGAAGHD